MADIQVAYRFVQAARRRRNEILGSPALPFSSVPVVVRSPVESPSVVTGVISNSTNTTVLVSATPLTYPSPGSTGLLDRQSTQLDTPALPVTSTSLVPTNLQYASQSSSPPMQTLHLPSEPVTITFADAKPVPPLADSGPQEIIHLTSYSTGITGYPPQVTTETVLQEVVTISLSVSGSDSNVSSKPASISIVLPTPTINDTDSASHSTDAGRPVAKAIGKVFSYQPTSGTPSSTPALPLPLYPQQGPQQDPHLGLNPVAVVGCVLAGILSLTVVSFGILWVLRSRRRSQDDKMAIL